MKQTVVLVGVAALSLVAGIIFGANVVRLGFVQPAQPENVPAATDRSVTHDDPSARELTEAIFEIERLRGEIVQLQTDYDELEQASVDKALELMFNRLSEKASTMRDTRTLVTRAMEHIRTRDGEWFAGLTDSLLMVHDVARMGDRGVAGLIAIADDPEADTELRKLALELLCYIPNEASLEYLMTPHPELDYEGFQSLTDATIRPHIERLPTEVVAPYFSELNAYLSDNLADGASNRDSIDLLALLAFVHNDAASREMLAPALRNPEPALRLLNTAEWIGNAAALEFIASAARTHPDGAVRQHALDILDGR